MMPFLLAAALLASPTNSPSAFGTEAECTFECPSLAERDVWLECSIDFTPTPSNRVEMAFGADVDHDGALSDAEVGLVVCIDRCQST